MNIITKELLDNVDKDYRDFAKKLIPDTNYDILGVRVPTIKKIAKKYSINKKLINDYLSEKHCYYEEWFAHGILIGLEKRDVENVLKFLDDFLPYLDNWAICDSTSASLKIIKRNKELFFEKIKGYLNSNNPYTVRFAITLFMNYFLEEQYLENIFKLINNINSNHYYINMAIAWLYSVSLVKHYDKTITMFAGNVLSDFIHNKSIQKAIESFRIPQDKKLYLKTLKRKKTK